MQAVGKVGERGIETIETVITHGGSAHADDFLAVAVLLTKFPVPVYRVNAVDPEVSNAIVVDIGGKYDGERFFDHHHDSNLPCSLVLVLQRFFPDVDIDCPEVQFIDDWDRIGPAATQKKWGLILPPFRDPIADMVLKVFSKYEVIEPGTPMHEMLIQIGEEFLEFLKKSKEFLEKAKNGRFLEVKGLWVAMYEENIPIKFVKRVNPNIAIAVQPNQRVAGAYTLTRIDDHPRVDFRRIKDKVPAHFIHNTGFMAVVDPKHIIEALKIAIE